MRAATRVRHSECAAYLIGARRASEQRQANEQQPSGLTVPPRSAPSDVEITDVEITEVDTAAAGGND
ncbi:MAG: hypothetical protein QNJ12_13980 [Ilumatobacter sp.]|uniref:hypothetical protein n=1 Tax=Ilumatobacter sp. TaxID=1967498 RepID=UPI002617FD7B|nr:hypothetical protein [Ilumatobacter sp.]MDJ0769905.1 hypothetical protein [Ilumatobacter sp.]